MSLIIILSCDKRAFKPTIKVVFLKGSIDTVIPINCQKINNTNGVVYQDTVIDNGLILNQILQQTKLLKAVKKTNNIICDIRVKCILYRTERDSLSICLSQNNCIVVNDKLMQNNDLLNFIIKKNIGYYNYFSLDDLKYFDELKGKNISDSYMDLRRKKASNGIPLPPR